MKREYRLLSLLLVLSLLLGSAPLSAFAEIEDEDALQETADALTVYEPLEIYDLQAEYKRDPLGVDVDPRLSWKLSGEGRGRLQTAYQIVVAEGGEEGTTVLDTGKVVSDEQNVLVSLDDKQPSTRYFWRVKVWDENDQESDFSPYAFWETGLLSTDQSGWPDGIEWIGIANSAAYPADQHSGQITDPSAVSAYRFEFDFSIPEGNDKFSLVFGARDKLEYAALEIDVSGTPTASLKHLRYKRSISPDVSGGPIKNDQYYAVTHYEQDVSEVITEAGGTYHLRLVVNNAAVSGEISKPDGESLALTGATLPDRSVSNQPRRWYLYTWGFNTTGSAVQISNFQLDNNGSRVFLADDFSNPNSKLADLGAIILGEPNQLLLQDSYELRSNIGATMLRKEFDVPGQNSIQYARLYATARGVYDAFINGERVADVYFNPTFTEFTKRLTYQTYDVTDLLVPGENAIAVYSTKGWYGSANTGYSGKNVFHSFNNASANNSNGNYSGDLMAFIEVEYADGTRQVLVKTDETWSYSDKAPVLNADIMDGEIYDANLEQPGWDLPGFDEAANGWVPAGVKKAPNYTDNITLRNNNTGSMYGAADGEHGVTFELTAQITEPAVVERILPALNLTSPTVIPGDIEMAAGTSRKDADGNVINGYVYDLGQNMVGVPEITVRGQKGTQVRITGSEISYANGWPYNDNYRSANATMTYTMKGDPAGETWAPRFSFNGFRYVILEFVGEEPEVLAVNGLVLTNTPINIGEYESSNEMVNQLQSNIQWGQRGNYLMVPMDCPQRNERMGWTGDTQVFASTAAYNVDVTAFLNNWLESMRDSQVFYNQGGAVPDTVPLGGDNRGTPYGCSGWADSGVIVPWELYMATGDIQILEDTWEIVRDSVLYRASSNAHLDTPQSGTGNHAIPDVPEDATGWVSTYQRRGDHLSLDPSTPWQLTGTAYAAYTCGLGLEIAKLLGKTEYIDDFQEYYDNYVTGFRTTYMPDNDGSIRYRGARAAQYAYWPSGLDGYGNTFASTTYSEDGDVATKPSQTAYALAIDFGLVPDEWLEAAGNYLVETVRRGCSPEEVGPGGILGGPNRLSTGFLGVAHLNAALTKTGHTDVAYELLENEEYPSWLYSVAQGSTTMWERWSSYIAEGDEVGPQSMNSFNHYSFGCIGDWMYNTTAGIAIDRENPGYKHIILKPTPGGTFTYAKSSHISSYGMIESGWEMEDGIFTYDAVVPVNTTATVYLPVGEGALIKENGTVVSGSKGTVNGVAFAGFDEDTAVFEIGSGTYRFVAEPSLLTLTTEAHNVNLDDYFEINASFREVQPSNVVVLNYTFDGDKFEYVRYADVKGVSVVTEEAGEGYAKITVMIPGYGAEDLGSVVLRTKEGAILSKEKQRVRAEAEYVLKDELDEKAITTAIGSVTFTTLGYGTGEPGIPGDTNDDRVVDLIDLSNMIDWFGLTSDHPAWESTYTYFDYNKNGEIDIQDIVYVAQLIK